MGLASDIAAWVGATAGLGSLGWQVRTWRRSAHDVAVRVSNAWPQVGGVLGDHWIEVTAVNNGSGAVTITGWGITAGGGANIVMINPLPESKPLPHRLEGGSDAKFYIPADHVKAQHLQRDVPYSQMRPWVRLATGREVVCRRGVPMRD